MATKNPKGPFWIKTIQPEESTGELKEFYDLWEGANGSCFSLMPAFSLHFKGLMAYLKQAMVVQRPTEGLTAMQRQMIITAVSKLQSCAY